MDAQAYVTFMGVTHISFWGDALHTGSGAGVGEALQPRGSSHELDEGLSQPPQALM